MSFAPREYLQHILAEADYLVTHSRELAPETFQADETLRRAFVRSLEIIGEAARTVPSEFRERHPYSSTSIGAPALDEAVSRGGAAPAPPPPRTPAWRS